MLIQDFVPNDGDYRVLVMGGEVKLVIHRKSNDDGHLNNTSKGGSANIIDIKDVPQVVLDESIKISELLKREITGVDMIQHKDTGEFFMLEVNNMPQLSTGSFVEEKAQVLSDFLSEWA
jgi:glutathione synthase/RimK-type ligase-like ATP-grasp enzyme